MHMHRMSRIKTYAALGIAAGILCSPAVLAQGGAPKYEPDLAWPKPLPDRWVLGGLGGVCVDVRAPNTMKRVMRCHDFGSGLEESPAA